MLLCTFSQSRLHHHCFSSCFWICWELFSFHTVSIDCTEIPPRTVSRWPKIYRLVSVFPFISRNVCFSTLISYITQWFFRSMWLLSKCLFCNFFCHWFLFPLYSVLILYKGWFWFFYSFEQPLWTSVFYFGKSIMHCRKECLFFSGMQRSVNIY